VERTSPVSDTLRIVSALAGMGGVLYIMSSLIIVWSRDFGRSVPEPLRTIRAELKPFALPLLLTDQLPGIATEPSFWKYLFFAIGLYCWWAYRSDEDDDDRWKRRKQKLADKVAEVGGRLQVVPAGGAA
jgi:hypothetical protein